MPNQTHTLMVGDIELTVHNDGRFLLPAGYFANVPADVSLGEQVEIGANLWTLRTGERLFLVDTGSANALTERFPDTGQAWPGLETVDPTDIILTHMHADHMGALADPSAFPGAKIHVTRVEWDFWTNPTLPDAVPADMRPMVEMIQAVAQGFADRVVLHDGQTELAPGIGLVPLPGHTAGHTGVLVSDKGQELMITGDAIISERLQFTHPGVAYALDGDPEQAVSTRRALLQRAASHGLTIAATHFAFPGVGKVQADGDTYSFAPM